LLLLLLFILFQQTIPATIGRLSKLRTLDLRSNSLSSENIPPQLARYKHTKETKHKNETKQLNRTVFKMRGAGKGAQMFMSKSCCVAFKNCCCFVQVLLSQNVLTTIPLELTDLKLKELDLANNVLTSVGEEIGNNNKNISNIVCLLT
jgi:hypothetical protein